MKNANFALCVPRFITILMACLGKMQTFGKNAHFYLDKDGCL